MKAQVQLPIMMVEVEGKTQADVFEEISNAQEVFSETVCGCCKSANISYRVREVEDNKYYEMHCKDCNARLEFGQMKKPQGRLYPKRKNKEGKYDKVNRGWSKYIPEVAK